MHDKSSHALRAHVNLVGQVLTRLARYRRVKTRPTAVYWTNKF